MTVFGCLKVDVQEGMGLASVFLEGRLVFLMAASGKGPFPSLEALKQRLRTQRALADWHRAAGRTS